MRAQIGAMAILTLLTAGAAAAQQLVMAGGAATGSITVSGGSTLRSWSCDVTRFEASVRAPSATAGATLPSGGERASFAIPVNAIDCRNRTMNGHLREALRGGDHPEIGFELASYTVTGESTLLGEGTLTVAGRPTPIRVEASYTRGEGTLRVQGQKALLMTELGVEPPTLMFGTLKVHDRITIAFDLVIQQSAVTLAALSAASGR